MMITQYHSVHKNRTASETSVSAAVLEQLPVNIVLLRPLTALKSWQWWQDTVGATQTTSLAVIGSSSRPCCTSSTSTCSSVWYLRTVLEHSVTQMSTWLCAANRPLDGTISNSFTDAAQPAACDDAERLHTDGSWPSSGTRRWNVIGTRDTLDRVHVRLDVKPACTNNTLDISSLSASITVEIQNHSN